MAEQDNCTKCGAPLPASVRGGLCPACMLKRGLETNTVGFTDEDQAQAARRWTPPTVDQLAGIFGELDILELIGRGGMGAVYKAREKQLDRVVALKILPPEIGREPAFAQRFAREAQAMAKLSHTNIVTIHSFGQRNAGELAAGGDLYFFIMEYVDGLSLRQLLDAHTVSPKEALAIVPQICDALQYAHDRGIVHRDIKPANILLDRDGQVKIADFGLAKLVGLTASGADGTTETDDDTRSRGAPGVTQAGEKVMGTPQYMSPEQIEHPRDVDHRADIYSLGVVFYQMLTGELPKGGSGNQFEPPSRKVVIDVRLDEVVLRALEREPDLRYQQVSEVRTQVETIVETSSHSQRQTKAATAPPALSPEAATQIERARQAVKAPAIGMIVATGINLAVVLSVLALALIHTAGTVDTPTGTSLMRPSGLVVFVVGLGLIGNVVILLGAMRMMQLRSRGLAITAAILAIIASPGNIIGLPMGIWALVVLSRRETVEAFKASQRDKTIRKSRTALWIGFVVVLGVVLAGAGAIVYVQGQQNVTLLKGWHNTIAQQKNPAPEVASRQRMVLGPVIERVVNHTGENCLIDLDTGTLVTPPTEAFEGGSKTAIEWARKNGIDAGGGTPPAVRGLIGFDIIALPFNNKVWNLSGDAGLMADKNTAFAVSTPGNPVYLSAKGGVPTTYKFQTREGGLGMLQIVGFTDNPKGTKIRYKMLQVAGTAPQVLKTTPLLASSRLEFRIAPSRSALDKAELSSYMTWLNAGRIGFWWKDGSVAGIAGRMPEHAWLPFIGDMTHADNLVTGEYKGQKYVLVSDRPSQAMLPGIGKGAWSLAKAYATTDGSGRPAIGFELDDRGGELFAGMTKANLNTALAIVIDGKVVSAPVVQSVMGKHGIITGLISETEAKALAKSLVPTEKTIPTDLKKN